MNFDLIQHLSEKKTLYIAFIGAFFFFLMPHISFGAIIYATDTAPVAGGVELPDSHINNYGDNCYIVGYANPQNLATYCFDQPTSTTGTTFNINAFFSTSTAFYPTHFRVGISSGMVDNTIPFTYKIADRNTGALYGLGQAYAPINATTSHQWLEGNFFISNQVPANAEFQTSLTYASSGVIIYGDVDLFSSCGGGCLYPRIFTGELDGSVQGVNVSLLDVVNGGFTYDFDHWHAQVTNWDSNIMNVAIAYSASSTDNLATTTLFVDASSTFPDVTSTSEIVTILKENMLTTKTTVNNNYTCAQAVVYNKSTSDILATSTQKCFYVSFPQNGYLYYQAGTSTTSTAITSLPNINGVNIPAGSPPYIKWILDVFNKFLSYPPIGYVWVYLNKFKDVALSPPPYNTTLLGYFLPVALADMIKLGVTSVLWIRFGIFVVHRVKYFQT